MDWREISGMIELSYFVDSYFLASSLLSVLIAILMLLVINVYLLLHSVSLSLVKSSIPEHPAAFSSLCFHLPLSLPL